jgi:HEAT repeats
LQVIESIEQFIRWVNSVAPVVLAIALFFWLVLTVGLLAGRRLSDRYQRVFRAVGRRQDGADVQRILAGLPARVVARAALDPATPATTAPILARHVVVRRGVDRVVRAASRHTGRRDVGRRVRALRLLALAGHPALLSLLDAALHSGRDIVVDAAVSVLGKLDDEQAARLLLVALRERLFQRSRVATELDHFRTPVAHLIRQLLDEADASLRYWGAALAARYVEVDGFTAALARLARDAEPKVRKAAIQSLRSTSDPRTALEAARLTGDAVFYVRAHAARTLVVSRHPRASSYILPLLRDPDWWVRLAAQECLASYGSAVVPAVLPFLESTDPVMAEGAAAILHNVGYMDEMVRKAAGRREEDAVSLLRPLVAAGGEMLISTVLARYSISEKPALARLESALRRAAHR